MFNPPNKSRVMCHVSHITCHNYYFLFFSWTRWWACFQRGLPCLVFTVKHLKIRMNFSFCPFFLVCSIGHLQTQKKFFLPNNSIFFFNVHERWVLYQFKIIFSTINWCGQEILFISVKYFKICIRKIFMRQVMERSGLRFEYFCSEGV